MRIGILFDLDGTLLDTLEDLRDAVNHALSVFSLPPRTLSEVRAFVGNGAATLISRAVAGRADENAVLNEFRAYYQAHCRVKTAPYRGIPEALASLGEKYPLAIVSNKPDSAVKALCRDYFPHVFALGETPDCPRKPAPDMLVRAMDAIGVDTCIYVGDSEVDVRTAQNAHVRVLSVLWGFRDRAEIADTGGSCFCDDLAKLVPMLEALIEEVRKNG